MLAITRHEKIIEWLERHRSVKVAELSEWLNVTEKTIREDLEKLEQRGLLKRIHGGAILAGDEGALLPLSRSRTRQYEEKKEIAAKALKLIEEDDVVALDGGTTTLEMAKAMDNKPLTVITNDLHIISELVKKERIRLVVPGGQRQRNLLVGPESVEYLKRLNIQKSFVSATAVDLEHGLTVFTSGHVELKQALIRNAGEVYAVADHSKFGKCALLTFAALDELNAIVTDRGIDPGIVREYEEKGVRMII